VAARRVDGLGEFGDVSTVMRISGREGLVALLFATAACSTVTIDANRKPDDPTTLAPVAIVIHQEALHAAFVQLLGKSLSRQAERRKIAARLVVITGAELDEQATIHTSLAGMRGMISLAPAGGKAHLWDARAFVVTDGAPQEAQPIWRARINVGGGDAIDQTRNFAEVMMRDLVDEHVLDGVHGELPKE
jgi:hypothetical protein